MNDSDINRYEGLNLPDLMELMHPIIYSDVISYFPETVAWRILGLWLMAILIITALDRVQHYRAQRYRREAMRKIQSISDKDYAAAQSIASLVKRTAMAAYSRDKVSSLTGSDWRAFLLSTSEELSDKDATVVASAAYDPKVSVANLKQAAIVWIRSHRV